MKRIILPAALAALVALATPAYATDYASHPGQTLAGGRWMPAGSRYVAGHYLLPDQSLDRGIVHTHPALTVQAAAPMRCQTPVTYMVNVSAIYDPALAAEAITLTRQAAANLSAAVGQRYVYAGTTTFVPTQANYTTAPATDVIAFVSPAVTDFYAPAPGITVYGYTRWDSTDFATAHTATTIDPAALTAFPATGPGPSALALVEHEMERTVGVEFSPNPTDIIYAAMNPQTPVTYSANDLAMLAATPCR